MDHIVSVLNITELKAQPGNVNNIVMTSGASSKGDGGGKIYYFDNVDNNTVEDTVYWNTVVPINNVGRWKAVFTRMLNLPHGILEINAGKKSFYLEGISNSSNSTGIKYLTMDNTLTGTPIFTKLLFESCIPNVAGATKDNVITANRTLLSTDLRQISYTFSRPPADTILNLSIITTGITIGTRTAPAGTPYLIKVEGM